MSASSLDRVLDLAEQAIELVEEVAKWKGLYDRASRWGDALQQDMREWAEANLAGDERKALLRLVDDR